MAEPERPQEGAISHRISQEIAAIHEESYGRPPKVVTTYLLDDAVVSVIERHPSGPAVQRRVLQARAREGFR
jgi:uncharacterized protein YbcI